MTTRALRELTFEQREILCRYRTRMRLQRHEAALRLLEPVAAFVDLAELEQCLGIGDATALEMPDGLAGGLVVAEIEQQQGDGSDVPGGEPFELRPAREGATRFIEPEQLVAALRVLQVDVGIETRRRGGLGEQDARVRIVAAFLMQQRDVEAEIGADRTQRCGARIGQQCAVLILQCAQHRAQVHPVCDLTGRTAREFAESIRGLRVMATHLQLHALQRKTIVGVVRAVHGGCRLP